jgi:hypothetical protein
MIITILLQDTGRSPAASTSLFVLHPSTPLGLIVLGPSQRDCQLLLMLVVTWFMLSLPTRHIAESCDALNLQAMAGWVS